MKNTNEIPDMAPEYQEWLQESFIMPLIQKDFELKEIFFNENREYPITSLVFEDIADTRKINAMDDPDIKAIIYQDDDSQPFSTAAYYFGTLWVFIPSCP